jgi:hypothetical protein
MLPFSTTTFYKQYLYRHFAFKQRYLMMLIENAALREAIVGSVRGAEDKELLTTLKIELHFSYLHLIETLFEFIFAVDETRDDDLWQALADSDGHKNYKRIDRIADGDTSELDRSLPRQRNGEPCVISHLQYALYHHWTMNMPEEEWIKNLNKIKQVLIKFANDFKDRNAYNAYKHAFRLFQTMKSVEFGKDPKFTIDLSDSFTFVPPKEKWKHVIENHDYRRDHKMAMLAFEMLSNIIETRRGKYFGDAGTAFYRWNNLQVEEFTTDKLWTRMEIEMTPVYAEDNTRIEAELNSNSDVT